MSSHGIVDIPVQFPTSFRRTGNTRRNCEAVIKKNERGTERESTYPAASKGYGFEYVQCVGLLSLRHNGVVLLLCSELKTDGVRDIRSVVDPMTHYIMWAAIVTFAHFLLGSDAGRQLCRWKDNSHS